MVEVMPKDRIQEIIKKHKNQKGALTQTLLEIQKELNITLKEATQEISKQLNIPTIEIFRIQNEEEIENEFLEGTKDENLGVYNELFSAKKLKILKFIP